MVKKNSKKTRKMNSWMKKLKHARDNKKKTFKYKNKTYTAVTKGNLIVYKEMK